MKASNTLIYNDWDIILKDILQENSFKKLMTFIQNERKKHTIFPENEKIFSAFKYSSFSKTKVVIIGQDPYHNNKQANGLAFSVNNGQKIPPSLRNIFKELYLDLQIPITNNGDLKAWADQGVLLLNTILTVRKKEPGSHQNIGWQNFTNTVISRLSLKKRKIIFLLWGAYAQKKAQLINEKKHYILQTSHPSPFSANKGFIGSGHFSKTNKILIKNNYKPINWNLCKNTLTLF